MPEALSTTPTPYKHDWKPGEKNGKPIRTNMVLPIRFKLK